ncbi:hypothetical protein [Sphaerotilus sp.]|uniref:hypothetical protein n=1 Tax=Sphaerotilus sp. TaxID=2093942 RepID=UPI002ACE7EE2|nr:hypothetical protein [Sphaerotilus sp.]MDZ7856516.1 hypothetical protein [Sphaerotilus sp.]
MKEDLRTAVSLSVTLSGQLVQATVSLLTAQVAYVAYALASRETVPVYFEGTAFFTLLFFIGSIYLSGRAITRAIASKLGLTQVELS